MSRLLGLRHRLRALLSPGRHARELEEEMAFHLELETMQQQYAGRSPDAAREAALRFGNRSYYREETRRMTWYGAFDTVRQDARYAWRSMVRSPSFTLMVVLTLALGIGVNAASFTVLDLLFLRAPGGIERPDELRRVYFEHHRTRDQVPFTSPAMNYPMYREMIGAVGDSSRVALFTVEEGLRLGRHPRDPSLRGVYATANYFPLLGARAAVGRVYGADEDRLGSVAPVAVISHRLWQARFGGDTAAIGKSIEVDGTRLVVIGVLPPQFGGTELQGADLWMPLASLPSPSWMKGPWWKETINMLRFRAIYRLDGSRSVEQIDARATAAARRLQREIQPKYADSLVTAMSGSLLEARSPGKPRPEAVISSRLGAVALLVLLIACANVVNLLLARTVRRRHEFSIRLALGISRARLVRLLTIETIVLALVAAVPAVLLAWWGGSLLRTLLLPDIEWHASALTARVVLFAIGTALLAGAMAGLVPAVQASRPGLADALKSSPKTGGAHRSRLRTTLVVTQAALSLVLLTGAVLFVRSLRNVQSLDIGYDAPKLLFGGVQFAKEDAPTSPVVDASLRALGESLRGRAGVTSVAYGWMEPMRGMSWTDFWTARDSAASLGRESPTVVTVSPGFFATVGMRVTRGRVFGGSDRGGTAPDEVMVNESLARRLWPEGNPLGQCMHIKTRDASCHTVVGVVEDARLDRVIEPQTALQFYLPLGNRASHPLASLVMVRTDGSTAETERAMRAALRAQFPAGEPWIHTMTENLEPQYRPWRLGATLFTGVGVLALMVALLGIYSTVSYSVAQRTHEFGVRIALGARLTDLLRQVIGEGVRMVLFGVVAGILLALAAGRLIASLLYGVEANDPSTMFGVAAAMLVAAALAAVVPAWRAARVDPVTALRSE